ncbi:MAG: STAS domain-containing protein [Syntrophobacterales bacterium]|nr:MAG: STAS domain-containing protein [Syntrophobacterales bacterium]
MKIEVIDTQRNGIHLVRVEGRLDAYFSSQLEDEIDTLLEQKTKSIILDFSEVTYLSSSGLRVLLSIHKETEKDGGLVLINLRDIVKKVIEVAELDDYMKQAETVEEAMAILEGKMEKTVASS